MHALLITLDTNLLKSKVIAIKNKTKQFKGVYRIYKKILARAIALLGSFEKLVPRINIGRYRVKKEVALKNI